MQITDDDLYTLYNGAMDHMAITQNTVLLRCYCGNDLLYGGEVGYFAQADLWIHRRHTGSRTDMGGVKLTVRYPVAVAARDTLQDMLFYMTGNLDLERMDMWILETCGPGRSFVVRDKEVPGCRAQRLDNKAAKRDSLEGTDAASWHDTGRRALIEDLVHIYQLSDRTSFRCFNCKKKATKKCAACLVTRFCSQPCMTASWPIHKRHCKMHTGETAH